MTAEPLSSVQDLALAPFATTLRDALRRSRLPLRAIRQRLTDRGHDISVSTLSLWQCNARRPERAASIAIVRELEQILRLDPGELTDSLGPSRRLGSMSHADYPPLTAVPSGAADRELDPELLQRSSAVGVHLDAGGRIVRTVDKTLWQARRDGARRVTVFCGTGEHDPVDSEVIGTIGCDLIDAVADHEHAGTRATLQLHAPLAQGELAMTERHSIERGAAATNEVSIVAPRRQAEFLLYVVFDQRLRPRRCRVTVETNTETRSHVVPFNGDCVTHAESTFGPGTVTLHWDW